MKIRNVLYILSYKTCKVYDCNLVLLTHKKCPGGECVKAKNIPKPDNSMQRYILKLSYKVESSVRKFEEILTKIIWSRGFVNP